MRIVWSNALSPLGWLAPAMLGVLFVLFGLLVFALPELLAYLVASMFVFVGVSLIGSAWLLRSRVRFRRLDDPE